MFAQDWMSKKRQRDEDDGPVGLGFGEHRVISSPSRLPDYGENANSLKKRRIATLPHRTSPSFSRHSAHAFPGYGYASQPTPPTITPVDSESEEMSKADEFSETTLADTSPEYTVTPCSPGMMAVSSTQSSGIFDTSIDSDDCEMSDSILLSPGNFHDEASNTISGRIPTPIHSSFAPQVRAERAVRYNDPDFADDEAIVDKFRRGRDLPSPISEGEMSPSTITDSLSDMQMESMEELERNTPTKKGHARSKHSLRNWDGFGGQVSSQGTAPKKTFSIGYRADCEKCRNKVPGHFSHIITS
jgi:hypothetical protein